MVNALVDDSGIVEVAVNAPLRRLFHYRVPDALRRSLARGHRVLIPFGRQTTTGVCVGFPSSAPVAELKAIREILHPECRFDEHLLELTRWIAEYYHAPWGEILEAALPPSIRSGKEEKRPRTARAAAPPGELRGAAERLGKRAGSRARLLALLAEDPGPHLLSDLPALLGASAASVRAALKTGILEGLLEEGEAAAERPDPQRAGDPGDAPESANAELHLSSDQENSVAAISAALEAGGFAPFLLHGITGSGKTEVYIRALRRAAALGGSGLVLVPEIALTPQTVRRFRSALPGLGVSVLHSMLTPRERAAEWRNIQEGKARVAIGARSAIFAPFRDLRIIIVDEEHEPSYKQDTSPRYHARDVAVMRARLLGIPAVLGSATPSVESSRNAETGKYRLLELPRRVTPHDLPSVSVVELGPEFYRPDGSGLIGDVLHRLIIQRLKAGEQTLLFLNRRGFSTFLHCLRCGFILRCTECDVAMTFHRQRAVLRCHLCDRERAPVEACPDCGMPGLRRSGAGTEKIMGELARRYPEARAARLDSDAVQGHRALREILARFVRREIDILVGTQMIAKGHDFPGVSLVGIICADTGLHLPDFRAAERTFQIITQVAGRAGRGERAGRVVVQTFFPEHYAIRRAIAGDYRGFYRTEIEHRRPLGYPPFGRVVRLLVHGEDLPKVQEAARAAGEALRERAATEPAAAKVKILGPAEAPIARIQGRHRHQILLKAATPGELKAALAALPPRLPGGVEMSVDVDPQSLL